MDSVGAYWSWWELIGFGGSMRPHQVGVLGLVILRKVLKPQTNKYKHCVAMAVVAVHSFLEQSIVCVSVCVCVCAFLGLLALFSSILVYLHVSTTPAFNRL